VHPGDAKIHPSSVGSIAERTGMDDAGSFNEKAYDSNHSHIGNLVVCVNSCVRLSEAPIRKRQGMFCDSIVMTMGHCPNATTEESMARHIANMVDDFLGKLPKSAKRTDGHVKADLLLVNCIDCRYPHAIHKYMHCAHERKVYDHLVLAGASLASTAAHTSEPAWAETFLEHFAASIDLHQIDGVLVLDHRTCGAYVKFGLLTDGDANTQREFDQHKLVATDALVLIGDVFRSKSRPAYIAAYLTPEIDLGEIDFPGDPELLCDLRV